MKTTITVNGLVLNTEKLSDEESMTVFLMILMEGQGILLATIEGYYGA